MAEIVSGLLSLATITFAVCSMLAVGLSYSVQDVLAPLKNIRGVSKALLANFILVPIFAIFVARFLQLDQPLTIGLLIVGTAAGAPFVIKLTTSAGGDIALSATLLVLLVPTTIVYLPLVVPLIAPGASVSAAAIAMPLILTMLLPIVAGMLLKKKRPLIALRLQPIMTKTSSYALFALVSLAILANLPRALDFTLRPLLAAGLLVVGAFCIGYLLGGRSPEARAVLGLATGQRNIAAAMVVATQTIEHRDTVLMVIITALMGLASLFPIASKLRGNQAARRGMDEREAAMAGAMPRA